MRIGKLKFGAVVSSSVAHGPHEGWAVKNYFLGAWKDYGKKYKGNNFWIYTPWGAVLIWWVCRVSLLLACFVSSSCQLATHEAHASAAKWEKDTNITWGGTTHTTGADGWDNATDHNASFQVAAQTAGVALGGYIALLQQRSADLTSQLSSANLTKLQIATLRQQQAINQANLDAATKQLFISTHAP